MNPAPATVIGHVRFRQWHIRVSRYRTDLGSLVLWLEVCQVDRACRARSSAERFGLVRVDDRGRAVHFSSGTADLHVQAHSVLAAAIAARALQIHLAAGTGYTVAVLDPDRIEPGTAAAALEAATRAVQERRA